MFHFALGAIAAPYVASLLIDAYGPEALFVLIAAGHFVLVFFGLSRLRTRRTPRSRTRYTYSPRTSFTIGRLTGKSRSSDGTN